MKTILFYVLSALLLSPMVKAQTAAADNKVQPSIAFSAFPKGADVYGIFEGRTPCEEVARQLTNKVPTGCVQLKWQLILFQDSVTHQPTTYALYIGLYGREALTGTWKIEKGIPSDRSAVVYALDYHQSGKALYLLKGDENILFVLDESRAFRVGDLHYNYTLNRVLKFRG
jgi:hypothetical protein